MDDLEHMNDLGYMDRKLWKITVFQNQVDEWRKNFHQWYKDEIKKKPEERNGWSGRIDVSKAKTKKEKNETSGQYPAQQRKFPYLEAHHVFGGANRKKSEEYGMKVYLCLEHHREGPEAVHRNHDMMRLVQQEGQRAFHLVYPEIDFRKEFGKNYLGEDKSC